MPNIWILGSSSSHPLERTWGPGQDPRARSAPPCSAVHAASTHVLNCPVSEGTGVFWADADALFALNCLSLTQDTLTAQILEKPLG